MRSQNPVRTIPIFRRFLWWCAGAQPDILKEFPTEWNKYSSIGVAVLTTALFAMLSGAYAASMIAQNVLLAFGLGIVWGIMNLNLDRLLASTTNKVPEGSHAAGLRNLSKAIPRVLLAIGIAITISSPIQIRLFEREIDQELEIERTRPIADLNDAIAKKAGELLAMQEALRSANDRVNHAQEVLHAEMDGWSGSRRYGSGPVYRERLKEYEQAKADAAKLKENIQSPIIQLTSQKAELESRKETLSQERYSP